MRGRLILFCSYVPGAGKTFEMLKYAEQLKSNGERIYPLFLDEKGRAYEKDNAFFQQYHSERLQLDDVKESEWAVLDELGMRDKRTKDYVCNEVEALLKRGVNILSSCNLQVFDCFSKRFESVFRIRKNNPISDQYLGMAESIYLIDRDPRQVVEQYRKGELFAGNNSVLEKYMNYELLTDFKLYLFSSMEEKYDSKIIIVSSIILN